MTMSKSVTCKQVAAYPGGCPPAPPIEPTRGEDGNLSPVYRFDCRAVNASIRDAVWGATNVGGPLPSICGI